MAPKTPLCRRAPAAPRWAELLIAVGNGRRALGTSLPANHLEATCLAVAVKLAPVGTTRGALGRVYALETSHREPVCIVGTLECSRSLLASAHPPLSFVVSECGVRLDIGDPGSLGDASFHAPPCFSEEELDLALSFCLLLYLSYLYLLDDSLLLDCLRASSTTVDHKVPGGCRGSYNTSILAAGVAKSQMAPSSSLQTSWGSPLFTCHRDSAASPPAVAAGGYDVYPAEGAGRGQRWLLPSLPLFLRPYSSFSPL